MKHRKGEKERGSGSENRESDGEKGSRLIRTREENREPGGKETGRTRGIMRERKKAGKGQNSVARARQQHPTCSVRKQYIVPPPYSGLCKKINIDVGRPCGPGGSNLRREARCR